MSPWTFKAHLEGLWLLGSLLAGVSLITGNAASWSLAEQSKAWFHLMGRGLLAGIVVYLMTIPVRLAVSKGGHHS